MKKKKETSQLVASSTNKLDSPFYSFEKMDAFKAHYSVIIGERSNGKTFGALCKMITNFWQNGKKSAYLRRYKEDFRGKRGDSLFESVEKEGMIASLTDGVYTCVKYYSGRWYLATYDPETQKKIPSEIAFCYAFALNDMEHDKSSSYPDIDLIVFDEFITRQYYLQNEFVLFTNTLSTIIRFRDDVRVYMLANTVNKYCPYFTEMGLSHVLEMEQGTIDLYKYGESGLKVAVEYCASTSEKGGKKSDVYFAFDNPALQLITAGAWELDIYPHCPIDFDKQHILFTYFILFQSALLQCEVVLKEDAYFTFIHRKTTPLKDEYKDIIFSDSFSPYPNHFRNIRKPSTDLTRRIAEFFRNDKVFYQDNEVGDIVANYLKYCTAS